MRLLEKPSEGTYTVTPSIARFWLANYNYDKQRPIRPWHVKNLANEMEKGRFLNKTAIHFCKVGSAFFLVNGQHSLAAIELSEIGIQLSIVIYDCCSRDEVADYFSRFDTHLTRRLSDSLYAHEVDEHFGITKTQLQWVAAASIYYAYMTRELENKALTQITHDEKMKLILAHGPATIRALNISDGYQNKTWVTRKTSLASVRILNDYDESEAFLFWRGVVEDDGLKQGDPRKTLVDLFKQAITTGGSYTGTARKTLPDAAWVKAIALAWNAHIERRSLKQLKISHVDKTREVEFSQIGVFRT